ncbi:hypothetical protein X777_11564 [Ooceraea biroi]|nr:hypothetical protein X777_11564 [Ooceraea biroi]
MGHDLQSYMLKKESPFRILESRNRRETQQQKEDSFNHEFSDFDSFPGVSNM